MITVTVGLQVSEPIQPSFTYSPHLKESQNKGSDWDEDSCSDVSTPLAPPVDDAYSGVAGQPDWQKARADCTTR